MRTANAVIAALVLLTLLAHDATADESGPYGACNDDGPCRYFKTETEFNIYVEASRAERMATRRKALDQLPVDERDCALPVLIDVMKTSGALREKGAQLYVAMGDGDIDASSREILARQGVYVLPDSSRTRGTGITKLLNSTTHTKYWGFSVMLMSVGTMPDTFVVGAGYHCGTLCAGRLRYTVKVNGKRCTILSTQLLSVS
jgi:hypothetical protein